jgi:hypothetical protein
VGAVVFFAGKVKYWALITVIRAYCLNLCPRAGLAACIHAHRVGYLPISAPMGRTAIPSHPSVVVC